jgi:hypothetical protein
LHEPSPENSEAVELASLAKPASGYLHIRRAGLALLAGEPIRQKTAHEQLEWMIEHDRQQDESQVSVRAEDELGQGYPHG